MGGPSEWLGYPIAEEQKLTGGGFLQRFEHGIIYWTPTTGAQPVKNDIVDAWGKHKWETGAFGYPVGGEAGCGGGATQEFQERCGRAGQGRQGLMIEGQIGKKYLEAAVRRMATWLPDQ